MGMNYYVISKYDDDMNKKIFNTYKEIYNTDKLNKLLKSMLMSEFELTLNLANCDPKYKYKLDDFEDRLNEAIKRFVLDIKYDVLDTFDLDEKEKIHIGKSSYGWLFCFQTQNIDINGIHLEWHNYNRVRDWLNEYVEKQKLFIIKDENGGETSVKELLELIDKKQKDPKNLENPDNFSHCINVDGYRFITNEFS